VCGYKFSVLFSSFFQRIYSNSFFGREGRFFAGQNKLWPLVCLFACVCFLQKWEKYNELNAAKMVREQADGSRYRFSWTRDVISLGAGQQSRISTYTHLGGGIKKGRHVAVQYESLQRTIYSEKAEK
jgi:hypothetical protein